MKNSFLLTIWCFIFMGSVMGQAVPNTTTFTLQNVVDVVNPTTDDLGDSFSDAIAGYYNLSYKNTYYADNSNKNNLLMFRDYGIHNCTKIISLSSVSGTTSLSISLNVVAYSTVIVHIGLQASETITAPAGWSSIYTITGAGTTYQASYKKTYTTATNETVEFTFSGSSNKIGLVYYAQNCVNATSTGAQTSSVTVTTFTTLSNLTEYACNTYVSSLLIKVAQTPTVTNGTDWTTVGSGLLNTWGYGAQKHPHPLITGSGVPTTSYSWSTPASTAHGMFRFY